MGLKPGTTGFGLEPRAAGNSSEPEVWWLVWCWERPGAWGQRGWPGLALVLDTESVGRDWRYKVWGLAWHGGSWGGPSAGSLVKLWYSFHSPFPVQRVPLFILPSSMHIFFVYVPYSGSVISHLDSLALIKIFWYIDNCSN